MSDKASGSAVLKFAAQSILRIPFTLVFVLIMLGANYAAGTFAGDLPKLSLQNWGISHQNIVQGELFRLISGTFLSHNVAMFLRQICFAAAVIGFYEWRQGSFRTILMFVLIDIVGSLVVLFAVLGPLDGVPWADLEGVRSLHDVGMSAGGFGLIGAIAATIRHRKLALVAILASIAAKVFFQFDPIADTAHVVTLLMGFALQGLLFGKQSNPAL